MFGQSVRHYNTISDAVDPDDPSCKAITVETEAFAVLNFENNLSKWKYYDKTLEDNYKDFQYVPCNRKKDDPAEVEFVAVEKNEKKILRIFSPKVKGKYTKSDCGQARYGGWSREGMVRYNKLVSFALQGRRHPKNCAPLERASLQAVRLKYGKTANTAEEEQLGKRKRDVLAPVDDGFTTLRYNRAQARGTTDSPRYVTTERKQEELTLPLLYNLKDFPLYPHLVGLLQQIQEITWRVFHQ